MILSERPLSINGTAKSDSSDEDFEVKVRLSEHRGSPKLIPSYHVTLDADNNDDVERLARRKSRLLEPHPATVGSPSATADASRRRADAAAPRGISPAQIGEHYGNCIRLAAENKITAKNAFNLHLIDYMSDMLKKEDYASFQIASSSLDAGAKIYAGRVDAVHQETYQVLTGLGRSDKMTTNDGNADENDTAADGEQPLSTRTDQRRKNQPHRDIIQKQLSKVRSKALVARTDIDPLFQHQTAAFDEGGTADLRLNQLCTLDEGCVLVLDSSTRVIQPACQVQTHRSNIGSTVEYLQSLVPKLCNHSVMCPSLANFRFTGWDKTALDATATDANDSVAPFMKEQEDEAFFPADNDDVDTEPYSDHAADELPPTSGPFVEMENLPVDVAVPEQNEGSRIESITNATESELFVSSLKSMLNKQYEHFGHLNDHILGMWAGPEHWRKKAKRRRFDPITGLDAVVDGADDNILVETIQTDGRSHKSRRAKKPVSVVVDYQAARAPGENRTRNGHLTRKTWSKSELSEVPPNSNLTSSSVFKDGYRLKASRQLNLLPAEWTDTRNILYQLCNREIVLETSHLVSNANNQLPVNLNGAPHEFNHSQENMDFCAILDSNKDQHANLNDGYTAFDHRLSGELDDLPGSPIGCDDDDDVDPLPFDGVFTQATAGHDELCGFGELDLISQPRKVARIEIGYARTAKMINVQRLKSAIWNFIESSLPVVIAGSRSPLSVASTSSAPDACSLPPSVTDEPLNTAPMPSALPVLDQTGNENPTTKYPSLANFNELVTMLPTRISWQMTKELSVPIVFNCLLHLSNEKELYLSCSDDLTDILITQGIPETELSSLKCYQVAIDSGDTAGLDFGDPGKARRPRPNKRPRSTATLDSWLADASPV